VSFFGTHLLIDLWGASHLDDIDLVRATLLECVTECGAKLRAIDVFRFPEEGGIAGVAMLMQSHITIHSWPEANYAAVDAFVCGDVLPYRILPVLKSSFKPSGIQITEQRRGVRIQ
jgi:S-adenosylmethionine decarboxylase